MTDRELEQRLADTVNRAAPDDLEAILSRCGGQNGSVMKLKELKSNQDIIDVEATVVKPKAKMGRWLAAACAALVLLGAGGGGLIYQQSYAVASVVSLDVNPSIELKINRGERVISCTALNEEAAAVLFSMDGGADLKGAKVDVAVNAIVGALVQAGYMDSISSAILISVEDKDQARAQRLQAELVSSVDSVLQTQAPGTDVLSQVVTHDAVKVEYGSFDSGISAGKAALVQKVLEMSGAGEEAFDKLAVLSVEELSDLLKAGEKRIPIGKDKAVWAAQEYAGTLVLSSNVVKDVDPELDETPAHYEVELMVSSREYKYVVDAFTGEVLSGQKDVLNTTAPAAPDPDPATPDPATQTPSTQKPTETTPSTTNQDVGEEAAKRAALSNAGLSERDVTGWKVERDWDDGRLEYEIEFWCGTTEYDCTVDGHTGAVLKCGIDHHEEYGDRHHSDPHHDGSGTAADTADVGQAAAKAAALTHAGVSESQTTNMRVERDWDDGRLEYDVEFYVGRTEYEYTVDGATGAILEYEWDD